ncbi:hypothetical protein [Plantactinospora sp. KBS50]|uniref:hypothetical protein n=1 Tax=Plantactinospora sp. KBS50 TaxID=2024580 RepID=UPI0012FD0DC1|nr:hypothetical protein [Plantactinospora sp. KBS50]
MRQQTVATGAVGGVSAQSLYVGGNGASDAHLHGDIDQVSVYAGAMSDREVRALYDNS